MGELQLTRTRIVEGVWEGVLTGADSAPEIVVSHLARPVEGAEVQDDPSHPGQFLVRVPVPVELLSEGTQTFVISEAATDRRLASFTVVMGQPLDEDIRAEMALLRAEARVPAPLRRDDVMRCACGAQVCLEGGAAPLRPPEVFWDQRRWAGTRLFRGEMRTYSEHSRFRRDPCPRSASSACGFPALPPSG